MSERNGDKMVKYSSVTGMRNKGSESTLWGSVLTSEECNELRYAHHEKDKTKAKNLKCGRWPKGWLVKLRSWAESYFKDKPLANKKFDVTFSRMPDVNDAQNKPSDRSHMAQGWQTKQRTMEGREGHRIVLNIIICHAIECLSVVE